MMAGWTMGTEAWIWMGAWAVVMILVVWLLVREPRQDARTNPGAILQARFARGEITEDELMRATRALEDASVVAAPDAARHHPSHPASPGQEARHE